MQTGVKALKGADRNHLSNLHKLAKNATTSAIHSFACFCLLPFVRDLQAAISSKRTLPNELIGTSTCIVHLQGSVEKVHAVTLKQFVSFGNYVTSFVPQVAKAIAGELSADESQAALMEWTKQSESLLSAVKAFGCGCFSNLDSAMTELTKEVECSLKGQVHNQAADHVTACLKVFEKVLFLQQLPSC